MYIVLIKKGVLRLREIVLGLEGYEINSILLLCRQAPDCIHQFIFSSKNGEDKHRETAYAWQKVKKFSRHKKSQRQSVMFRVGWRIWHNLSLWLSDGGSVHSWERIKENLWMKWRIRTYLWLIYSLKSDASAIICVPILELNWQKFTEEFFVVHRSSA